MSEKRFIWKCDDENCQIYDTKKKKVYFNVEVVDLLNEQQAIITGLNEQIMGEIKFSKSNDGQIRQNGLIMSTDEVVDYLNTANNAIGSLQYENAQLRKENKRLKERNDELEDELEESSAFIIEQRKENKTLKEENEQLKKKLESLQKVLHLVECVSDE